MFRRALAAPLSTRRPITMKLLLIHRYFWPDAGPYAHMLLHIGRRLAAAGHQVRVLAAQPSYHEGVVGARPHREVVDGVEIVRLRVPAENRRRPLRRMVSTGAFLARVGLHLLWHRYDLVVCATTPPIAQGWVVRVALRLTGRRGRYIYHCLDIYPEAAAVAGLAPQGWMYRQLLAVDAKICADAAAVVTLSRDMAVTLRARRQVPRAIHLVRNFSLVGASAAAPPPLPPSLVRPPGSFVVVFAGNLGRFQDLDVVIEAARLLRDDTRVHFWFVGDGLARPALEARAGSLALRRVHFHPYLPPERAFDIIRQADLALVPLRPGMHRVAHPSKTMTLLAAGCRLLVVMDRKSELVEQIEAADVGVWVPQGDPSALADAVRREADRGLDVDAKRRSVALGEAAFGRERALDRWVELVASLR